METATQQRDPTWKCNPICQVWAKSGSIISSFVEKSNAHRHGEDGECASKIYTPDADKGVICVIAFWDPFRRVLARLFVYICNFLVLISSKVCSLSFFFFVNLKGTHVNET